MSEDPAMELDASEVARARAETPGCELVLHFNNAGAVLMPQPVLDAAIQHLELEAAMGGYEAAQQKSAELEGVYGRGGTSAGLPTS